MSNAIRHAIAYWSTNSLSPGACVLIPCRAAIHACNLTSGNPGPVDNSRPAPIARRTWMALRAIGGGC